MRRLAAGFVIGVPLALGIALVVSADARYLARAGFEDVAVVPDVIRLRAYYPGMLAAAACGRRA